MSRIDKLGGYKNAKEAYELLSSCRWHRPQPGIDALGAELLEYRRANNIFEVGDRVVWKCMDFENYLYEVFDTEDGIHFDIELTGGKSIAHYVRGGTLDSIRHATDEEIAAGYRGAK